MMDCPIRAEKVRIVSIDPAGFNMTAKKVFPELST
jgi:hypothetical protein